MSTHFYSLKRVHLPAILAYLNEFAENENGRIVHWQIVPMKLEPLWTSRALYSCVIEFEKFDMVSMHPSS